MKFTSYFIKHPVIAIILNAMIVLLGILCFKSLSLREYPNISIPEITVTSFYPNASADLVESTVTNVIEDQLAGVEGLDVMHSQSNSGSSKISLLFRPGTSMDKALNATRQAASYAQGQLPSTVKPPLIEQQKVTEGLPFIGIALESSALDFGELTHYANLNLKNSFRGLKGVASVRIFGQPYTYAITLSPKKLYSFGINANDVSDAIALNHLSLPAGAYQNKIPTTLDFELKTPEDYENLLIKTKDNHPILLKSLATVKLTTDRSQFRIRVNGHSGLALSIERANDANPIEVSQAVHQQLKRLQKTLPDDIKMNVIIDQSQFIQASLKNIQSSILEAIVLVLIIIFIFLRSARATLIPVITIPISLLGALIFLKLAGFSINQMTLLAMVLAVGLVVDDAIIVLENIWRYIEEGLPPQDAAIKGAKQIGFAIVAMTLTLTSVYAPIAFINGMIGQLFVEFAVALAGSVFISGIVALTLSPLMCARFLNKKTQPLMPGIDTFLDKLTQGYFKRLGTMIYRRKLIAVVVILCIAFSVMLFKIIPSETAPKEDRGLIGIYTPMASADTIDNMEDKIKKLEASIGNLPEMANQLSLIGTWGGNIVIPLKPHHQRTRSAEQIRASLQPQMAQLQSMDAYPWSWDSGLPGVNTDLTGSNLDLMISTPESYQQLFDTAERIKTALDQSNLFKSSNIDLRLDTMGYSIVIDSAALGKLGLSPAQVAKTIEVFFSGDKSVTFQKDNVPYYLSLEGSKKPWTLDELYLTTPSGKRVSIGAIAQMKRHSQPATLEHVNQMRTTTLHAELTPQQSFNQGMDAMLEIARDRASPAYQFSWTGAAKAYNESSQSMFMLFVLSLLFIYAILAAQFEHFVYPFIVLFTVPLACFGALLFVYAFGQSMNIYTQVGLVTLVGLISKHGILIVEFANQLQKEGLSLIEATQKAASLRLRPILMTTAAMIFGAIPLILSQQAGAESRHAIGTVLIGGLCIGTLFTLFVLPAVYFSISKWIGNPGLTSGLKENMIK